MSHTDTSDGLQPITPRNAVERFLSHRESDSTEATIDSYHDRLMRFVRWLEGKDILNVNDVSGRQLQEYLDHRGETCNRNTLNNEFGTLKKLFEFLVAIEATEPAMPDKVDLLKPNTSQEERQNSEKLLPSRAEEILEHLETFEYGSRDHVMMLLAWRMGFRIGTMRAIDLRDLSLDGEVDEERLKEMGMETDHLPEDTGPHMYVIHRAETDSPLKNKGKGQRVVSLRKDTVDVLRAYVRVNRTDASDDFDREPLLTTAWGRPTDSTIRRRVYCLTHPCLLRDCPHGQERESCDYRAHGHESKCPSAKSPHKIRTGAISHMREQGIPPAEVAERVDATPETIRVHYDKSEALHRSEQRRDYFEKL